MSAFLSPVGLASTSLVANRLSVLATFKERLCKTYNAMSTILPLASVDYSYGSPTLVGTTVFVPITAKVNITIPSGCGCGCATPELFAETFYVAFQGQTALPTTVTITSVGRVQSPFNVVKGKSRNYVIEDSLTIAIA